MRQTQVKQESQTEVKRILEPRNSLEETLWHELDLYEKPVIALLKRFDRLIKSELHETNTATCSSCSGHIKATDTGDDKALLLLNFHPHIWIALPNSTTTAKQRDSFKALLKNVFEEALRSTHALIGDKVLNLDILLTDKPTSFGICGLWYEDEYLLRIAISYQKQVPWTVMKAFWSEAEKQLTRVDRIHYVTNTSIEDFVK